ncbi:MAG: sigma-70 family RNA polymerase sigma factor [Syntrophomonadaceae bacterium]|nr:sigma-70 family RNA polymerase sigma factor [Syntrophomonadaceae bacterium]
MDSIRELVKKAQHNDLGAFEQLVHIYKDRIFGLCLQLTRNQADAQDLAQETFIRAYTNLGSFRFEADFGTWLHRIAINQGINFQRKQKRDNLISLDAPIQTDEGEITRDLAATGEDPEELFEQRELQNSVHQALDKLSPEHRMVLVLREFQGYSYEEISTLMDCSLGTVKSRINRARQALRDLLPSFKR